MRVPPTKMLIATMAVGGSRELSIHYSSSTSNSFISAIQFSAFSSFFLQSWASLLLFCPMYRGAIYIHALYFTLLKIVCNICIIKAIPI